MKKIRVNLLSTKRNRVLRNNWFHLTVLEKAL